MGSGADADSWLASTAIKMLSPTDGWAVGNRVYHYDGDIVARGPHASDHRCSMRIAVVSPSNIWIVGGGQLPSLHQVAQSSCITMAMRWFPQQTPSFL